MDMGQYERDKRNAGRPPAWRSSAGRLREATPVPQREGKDQLTGYRPRQEENADRPRETGRLSGAYGDVAVGVSRKKDVTVVVSKKRAYEGVAATEDEQVLKEDSSRRMHLTRGNFKVNSHDEKNSALAYRESRTKAPGQLLGRFRELMHNREQHTLEEQAPFLDRKPERKALRRLQEQEENLRGKRGPEDRETLAAIQREKQRLRQVLTEKVGQERRLRLILQKAKEEAQKQAGEAPWQLPLLLLTPLEPEEELPPVEGGAEGPADQGGDKNAADKAEAVPADPATGEAAPIPIVIPVKKKDEEQTSPVTNP